MFITEQFNVSEAFPRLTKHPADNEDYIIEFIPVAWLPMGFQLKYAEFAKLQRDPANVTEDDIIKVTELAGEIFREIVTGWNLTDRHDSPIPVPSASNPDSWQDVPQSILMGLLMEAGRPEHGEIPLPNAQPSGASPNLPDLLNRQQRRELDRVSRTG